MRNRGWRPVQVFCAAAAAACATATAAHSEEMTVERIVERTNRTAYYQGADGRARVSMTITDSRGRARQRQFVILRRDMAAPATASRQYGPDEYCGDQKFYIYFELPADVRKMAFLVWKHVDGDDDRWLYLPALDLVKRIAAAEERTSFVGSDFFYEDVSGRGTDEDTHELAETTDDYYVLKNVPKDPQGVEFASYTMWVHRKTFLPVRIEYLDAAGEKYRVYEALKVEAIQGYQTVTRSRMQDLRTGGETVITYSDVAYDLSLPEDIFTERYLRRPPRKYLRHSKKER